MDKAIAANKAKSSDYFNNIMKNATSDQDAIKLTRQLLQVIPEERISANEAIRHPYVSKFFNPKTESSVCQRDVRPPIDDDVQLSIDQYRQKLYEIIEKDKNR